MEEARAGRPNLAELVANDELEEAQSVWRACQRESPAPAPGSPEAWCVRALLGLLVSERELYVGGYNSKTLLQILAAPSEAATDRESDGGLDVLASILVPDELSEQARATISARGADALRLLLRYWADAPAAPLVVRRGDAAFSPATLTCEDIGWFRESVSLEQVRRATRLGAEKLGVSVEGPPAAAPPPDRSEELSCAV